MRISTIIVAVAICGVLLAGCAPRPTVQDYDDVAAALGALVANESGGGEVGSMADCSSLATGDVPDGLTASGGDSFEGVRAGLSYEYGVTCLDDQGDTMDACDATTDSARVTIAWSGELSLPLLGYEGSISRTGDWTLSEIQSGPTLSGQGTFDIESEFDAIYRPVRRVFRLSYDATYDAVRLETGTGGPSSGSIVYAVHAERLRERRARSVELEFDLEATVTFGGAEGAVLDLGGSHRYSVDLANGEVEKLFLEM